MALTVKPAFSAGELDPALHERTTLDKYKNGLSTGRNIVVTKIGSIASRQGRKHYGACKLDDSFAVTYSPPGSGKILEFGDSYVREYTTDGVYIGEVATLIAASTLVSAHFETSGNYVYIFRSGFEIQKFNYVLGAFLSSGSVFGLQNAPISTVVTPAGTPTGYKVEYAVTFVINGQESFPLIFQPTSVGINVPIAAGQSNGIDAQLTIGIPTGITEMKVFRRPASAGAYGYIGSCSTFTVSGGNVHGFFLDLGQDADYSHSYPTVIIPLEDNPINLHSQTGIIYQQSLLVTDSITDLEAIYKSRTGYQNNFMRNYPLDSASALKFKAGTSGYGRILRMLDDDGLVLFTAAGIYLNQGELSPDNLSFAKKGKGIINPALPPLAVPGGSFYVDAATNAVRSLSFDWQSQKYTEPDLTIYSAHLFKYRSMTSWNFQSGVFPLLWVVYSDGAFASFTFEFDQEMKAWTRHDSSNILVESSCGTINADQTFFIVKKVVNGVTKRYIEATLPRYVQPSVVASNPEYNKSSAIAYMDSIVSYSTLLNTSLTGTNVLQLSPTTVDQDWSLPLNLTCGTSGIFGALNAVLVQVGLSIVGQIFRYFDSDGSTWDLQVTSLVDANTVIVQPSSEFPSAAAVGVRLYRTNSIFTGLDHMEGESVAVLVDGAVVCSPNNDQQVYPTCTVTGGAITLPNGLVGAIVHIGRPIIGDVETLDIDTVEQAPTLIESMTVNKLYVKVHNSQGIYVADKYPVDQIVKGMQPIDQYDVDYSQDNPIIGNRAAVEQTKRIEVTLPGNWKSNGRIAMRQVDPLHFEILSIIPDCEILNRSDR